MKKIFGFIALAILSVSAFAQTCVQTDVNLTGTASVTLTRYEHKVLTGVFSVAEDRHVLFSQGNLQYQASTDTWRFAENQWSRIGAAAGNTTATNRDTQAAWIDLFAWGTSGWDSDGEGITSDPTAISGTWLEQDLTGDYADADWAWYNAIINGGVDADGPKNHIWRTLTIDEWTYLLRTRDNSSNLLGFGSLMGVNGIYLLPDSWDWNDVDEESVLRTAAGFTWTDYATAQAYTNNVIASSDDGKALWAAMEEAGAVFLPTTGFGAESDRTVKNAPSRGCYVSSTLSTKETGKFRYVLFTNSGSLSSGTSTTLDIGTRCAVRAVYDLD